MGLIIQQFQNGEKLDPWFADDLAGAVGVLSEGEGLNRQDLRAKISTPENFCEFIVAREAEKGRESRVAISFGSFEDFRDEMRSHLKLSRKLDLYRKLHDGLSDMIESGRLKESDIPDDYLWLVQILEKAGGMD
jgi:maltose-binding protein MalE